MNSFRLVVFLCIILLAIIFFQQSTKHAQVVPQSIHEITIIPTTSSGRKLGSVSPTKMTTKFIYPNSTITATANSLMTLQSDDAPATITNWYKEKIRLSGFKTKTVIQTNTNGSIQNKLSGVRDNQQISIVIEREASEKSTNITVVLD